jgi:hypothetical protein
VFHQLGSTVEFHFLDVGNIHYGTGYEYDGYVFVAWVLQVRRAEVVTNDQPVSGHGPLFYVKKEKIFSYVIMFLYSYTR